MAYFNPYDIPSQTRFSPISMAASGASIGNSIVPGIGGVIGAGAGAITGYLAREHAYNQASNSLNDEHLQDIIDIDIYGKPTFNSSAALAANQSIDTLISSGKRDKRFRLFGSAARRKFGKNEETTAGRFTNELQSSRDQFNNQMMNYNNQQAAMAQYNQLLNNQSRLNNLYSIGTSLY